MAYNETSWVTSGTTAAVTSKGATLYAYFGIGAATSVNYSDGFHTAVPFIYEGAASTADNLKLGTGTDPATTFTTADGSGTDASLVVFASWYIPDNIVIDSVTHLEGADHADGDTTRMHLMSYTFTSGSSSCLTNGTLLAHNSDITNAGAEQAYLSTWTVDSASVSAGKVILATFRCDTDNSDYSLNVIVKYHLA